MNFHFHHQPAPRDNGAPNSNQDNIEFRPLKKSGSGATSGVYDEVMEGGHHAQKEGRFSYKRVDNQGYAPLAQSDSAPGHNTTGSAAPMSTFMTSHSPAAGDDDTYAVVDKKKKAYIPSAPTSGK